MVGKSGFTLIEIMIVVLIIGMITAFGVPRLFRSPAPVAQQFIDTLNGLVIRASGDAQEGEPRRVFFNLTAGTVEIQTGAGKRVGPLLHIPQQLQVDNVVINGISQFTVGTGTKRTFYFLLNPEGISQEVYLTLSEKRGDETRSYEFLLNPFTTVFRLT